MSLQQIIGILATMGALTVVEATNWILAQPRDSCNAACAGIGASCLESELQNVGSGSAVGDVAGKAGQNCRGKSHWAYDFSPSICTSPQCCTDGSCTGWCTFGDNGKRSCAAGTGGHHSRLCPCSQGAVTAIRVDSNDNSYDGVYDTSSGQKWNGKPVYKKRGDPRFCVFYWDSHLGWVIQPSPPSDKWLANAFGKGSSPVTANFPSRIKITEVSGGGGCRINRLMGGWSNQGRIIGSETRTVSYGTTSSTGSTVGSEFGAAFKLAYETTASLEVGTGKFIPGGTATIGASLSTEMTASVGASFERSWSTEKSSETTFSRTIDSAGGFSAGFLWQWQMDARYSCGRYVTIATDATVITQDNEVPCCLPNDCLDAKHGSCNYCRTQESLIQKSPRCNVGPPPCTSPTGFVQLSGGELDNRAVGPVPAIPDGGIHSVKCPGGWLGNVHLFCKDMVIHPTTDCWKAGLAHAATPPKAAPTYEPCADKAEGATCKNCAPHDSSCVETEVVKTCQAGECKTAPSTGFLASSR